MYVVVRTWSNAKALADAMEQRMQEVTDLISGVPGFVAYYATRSGDTVTTVTVCDSKEGTDESTRRAGAWVKQVLPGASIGAPQITEGETFIQF
jgi:heme-degrading monooxygenase HmoA